MFGDYWGDHVHGRLNDDILTLISDDNPDNMVKVLPTLKKGQYGSPQLLLSYKPSNECLDKLKELYRVRIFKAEDSTDYKYLMSIETLRFAFMEGWHFRNNDGITREVTGNRWDYDGYFYITDSLNSYRRIAIIPFAMNAYKVDGGDNMSKEEALSLVKNIVKRLNNNELI
jgi:hypothetical protein